MINLKPRKVGFWVLMLIFAYEAMRDIPARQRFFSNLPHPGWSHGVASFYVSFLPFLVYGLYLFFCQYSWKPTKTFGFLPRPDAIGLAIQGIAVLILLIVDQVGFSVIYGAPRPEPFLKDWIRTMLFLQGFGIVSVSLNALNQGRDEARAQLVAAQVAPHAIANIFATVEAIARNPEVSEFLCTAESYYRCVTEVQSRPLITLGEEFVLVRDYLEIQTCQMAHLLRVDWDWDTSVNEFMIPPLVVQTLAENAMKHGVRRAGSGAIKVSAACHGDMICIVVENTGSTIQNSKAKGSGLENLKKRLSYFFGSRAKFTLTQEGEWVHAEMQIPRRSNASIGRG